VASSADVNPENFAAPKLVSHAENVARSKLVRVPENVAMTKLVSFPENVAPSKLVFSPENVAMSKLVCFPAKVAMSKLVLSGYDQTERAGLKPRVNGQATALLVQAMAWACTSSSTPSSQTIHACTLCGTAGVETVSCPICSGYRLLGWRRAMRGRSVIPSEYRTSVREIVAEGPR
jgi:hypothetical protein